MKIRPNNYDIQKGNFDSLKTALADINKNFCIIRLGHLLERLTERDTSHLRFS